MHWNIKYCVERVEGVGTGQNTFWGKAERPAVYPPPSLPACLPPFSAIFQDNWRNGVMNLQLLEGSSWANVPEGGATALKIMSIDTGAGKVSYPGGIEIALVSEDSLTALCEDSCSFADDGQCDEPGVVRVVGRFVRVCTYRLGMYGCLSTPTPIHMRT